MDIVKIASAAVASILVSVSAFAATTQPVSLEGDFLLRDFRFKSGEEMPALNIHYTSLGKPVRDAGGRISNAVLLLHGTRGSGKNLMRPMFADVLFGPGQLLDVQRYYIVAPDAIGHGKSSKPSDGLRAGFPRYDYDDMVLAQKRLLEEGLGVNHLRLIVGTSMGCMHSFMWGETYPDSMDAMMSLACLPAPIAGRNRVWRKMAIDAIRNDPEWQGGNYATQPHAALKTVADLLILAGSAPIQMHKNFPTGDAADKYVEEAVERISADLDANDLLYAVSASRNYDPSARLESIVAPLTLVNSADDFINPPELAIAEREIKRIKRGRFVLLPASEQTQGHGTHSWAALWQDHLKALLQISQH
jgi:homoserine O-acetyltransferase/O-succinyltransferase